MHELGARGPRILLIEDDPDIAGMYALALTMAGYGVATAADGETGLEMMRRDRPDLLLLDVRLPGISGISVLERIADEDELRGLKVIMVSNFGEASTVRASRERGAADYIVKANVTPRELAQIIARQLLEP